ncbi:MAG: hypothetical protein ACLTMP_02975 [Eggerthella lenta]
MNAHGTGTPANDATESKALLALCGEEAEPDPVASVKGTTGHTLAPRALSRPSSRLCP